MMPWKRREAEAADGAQKAREEFQKARDQRADVEAIARAIRRQARRNGWMEDLEKIIGGRA